MAQIAYFLVYFAKWKLKVPKTIIIAMCFVGNWYRSETEKKSLINVLTNETP